MDLRSSDCPRRFGRSRVLGSARRVLQCLFRASVAVAGAETRSTIVEGYRVHYYALGPASGPPVVLVHGLGGRAEDWRNLAPYLTKAGYRVYLPDLPGYGQSEKPASFSYSVSDEAGVVVGFLDALGLKQVELVAGPWVAGLCSESRPTIPNA